MRIFLGVLFSLILINQGKAQKIYTPGHVILNSGDTLQGEIQDRNFSKDKLYKKIKFKNNKGKITRYSPYDISGYKVGDTEFESLWYKEYNEFFIFHYANRYGFGNKIFLRVLERGYLTCYFLEYIDADTGYLNGFELFKREGEDYFARATQGIFGLKKKKLSEYFKDCPLLTEKIESEEITKPLEVVDFYNNFCVNN